jgi:hypothetical protein
MSTNDGKSIFSQHVAKVPEKERPPVTIPRGPLLPPNVPPADHRSATPTEQLLAFVVNRWPGTTVSTRNIMQFGPGCLRERKSAIVTAKILVEHGWLHPLPTRQHRGRAWQIVRGPSQPVAPVTRLTTR